MCFSSSPSMPPAPAPTKSDAEVEQAALAERDRARKMRGRASTILTSGEGDPTEAPVRNKTLLGY